MDGTTIVPSSSTTMSWCVLAGKAQRTLEFLSSLTSRFCQGSRQPGQRWSRRRGDGRPCGPEDTRHGHGPAEEEQSAAVGGDRLVVAGAKAEEVAELIMTAAEPTGRSWALEAAHRAVSAFDAAVILLDGLIANDKFCLVRRSRLRLSWSRLALRERSRRASAVPAASLQSGGTDAMPVDRAPDDAAGSGRPASMGSGLPGGAGLDEGGGRRVCRRVARPRRAGGGP